MQVQQVDVRDTFFDSRRERALCMFLLRTLFPSEDFQDTMTFPGPLLVPILLKKPLACLSGFLGPVSTPRIALE